MEMNDNTILRIKVPAHLYEAVKAQLTLKEAKGKHNLGAGMEIVKEKKATSAPKKAAAPKNAEAPKEEAKVPKDGMKKAPKNKLGLEELKAIVELLNGQIAQLEEKKEEKAPVEKKEKMEEVKEVEEAREYDEFERDEEWDEETKSWVPVGSNRYRKFYKPKSHTGTATMTAKQAADVTKSSFSKFDPTMDPEDPRGGFR